MYFLKIKLEENLFFYFGVKVFEVTDGYSDLGVQFNNKSILGEVLPVNQSQRALYSLLTKSRNLNLSIDLQLHLFNQLVLPILLYGCKVSGFEDLAWPELRVS